MFGRKKASKKVGRKKVATKKAATKKAGPKKRLKRAQARNEFNKMNRDLNRPSTYENMGRRVSRKDDKRPLEGNEISQGTRVRTKGGRVRSMTKAEGLRLQAAQRVKYRSNDKNDAYRRRRAAAADLKALTPKKKKKNKRYGTL